MATELGVGYISILPEVSKISPGIADALRGSEKAVEKQGNTLGSKLTDGMKSAVKVGATSLAATATGVMATAVGKGLTRIVAIDEAKSKLEGLKLTGEQVTQAMSSVEGSVKGTSFGLDEAASSAAKLVANNVSLGKQLDSTLTLTADIASQTGFSMDEISSIMAKIAGVGKLTGETLNQLDEKAAGTSAALSQHLGVSIEEVRDKISKGEISFKTFGEAMEKYLGGAAQRSGETIKGSFKNTFAALGRLGVTVIEPFTNQATLGFNSITKAIDGLNDKIKPFSRELSEWLEKRGVPAIKNFKGQVVELWAEFKKSDLIKNTIRSFDDLKTTAVELYPTIKNIVTTIAAASVGTAAITWNVFTAALSATSGVLQAITPPLEAISGFLADHPALVTAAITAWGGFKVLNNVTTLVTDTVGSLKGRLDTLATAGKEAGGAMGVLKSGGSSLLGLFGGPLGAAVTATTLAVTGYITHTQNAALMNEKISNSTRQAEKAFNDLTIAAAGTKGALDGEALAAGIELVNAKLTEFREGGKFNGKWTSHIFGDRKAFEEDIQFYVDKGYDLANAKVKAQRALKNGYEALEEAGKNLGMSQEQVNAAIANGGHQYERLYEELNKLGHGGAYAQEHISRVREELDEQIDIAQSLSPEYSNVKNAVQALGDESTKTADKIDALSAIMDTLTGNKKSDTERDIEHQRELQKIEETKEKVKELAAENQQALTDMWKVDPSTGEQLFNHTSEIGMKLYEDMKKLNEDMDNMIFSGASPEEINQKSTERAQALADGYKITIDQLNSAMSDSTGMGFSEGLEIKMSLSKNVGELTDDLLAVVADVNARQKEATGTGIEIPISDIPEDQRSKFLIQLQQLYKDAEMSGDGNTIKIKADASEVDLSLRDIDNKLKSFNYGSSIPMTLDISGVLHELDITEQEFSELVEKIDSTRMTPEIEADLEKLYEGGRLTEEELNRITTLIGKPKIDVENSDFVFKTGAARKTMNETNELSATPNLFANNAPLESGVRHSIALVANLDSKTAAPNVNLDDRNVDSQANTIWNRIKSIFSRGISVGVSVVERFSNAATGIFRHGGGTIPAYATGGLLPEHTGYRLPTSGRGTEGVDRFTAIDRNGQAIARVDRGEWVINRRSSEKYDHILRAINAGIYKEKTPAAYANGGRLPGYTRGAKVSADELKAFAQGRSVRGQQAGRSLEGSPYVWGGVNWGDCSGAMAALARFAVGLSAFAGRFATGNQREALAGMGFSPGLGNPSTDFSIGWFNGGPYGGHTSGTIAGVNVEMGGGRGNGQYGGSAAGANNPQYTDHAHLKLGPTNYLFTPEGELGAYQSTYIGGGSGPVRAPSYRSASDYDYDINAAEARYGAVKRTSSKGISFSDGTTIRWNEIPGFKKYDVGGVLPHGYGSYNTSGQDEYILTNSHWRELGKIAKSLPKAGQQIVNAAKAFEKGVLNSQKAMVTGVKKAQGGLTNFGYNFGGTALFAGDSNVIKAREEYSKTINEFIKETADIKKAEEEFIEARKELVKVSRDNSGIVEATERKAEAEEKLAKARKSGKADDIKSAEKAVREAEKGIAQAREKSSDEAIAAQDKVTDSEDKLREARNKAADQNERLQQAQAKIAEAKYKAAQAIVEGIADTISSAFNGVSQFYNEMARIAGVVERTRQEVSKLELQQYEYHTNSMSAMHELRQREFDVTKARLMGTLGVAEAEAHLEDARNSAATLGLTSVEAMKGALDRFYVTGIFGIEELTESQIANNAKVKAAEWGVYVARAQSAIDLQEATYQQALAQYKVNEATLLQMQSTEILQLQTELLKKQTAELHGLTANQYSGAAKGIAGAGKISSGIGKVLGGVLSGLAGFAVGGPLGALAGAGMAISGITDVARGAIDVKNNKEETAAVWKEMAAGQKAAIIGGGILSGAAGIAGGAGALHYGADFATGMAGIGDQIVEATIGSYTYGMAAKLDKLNSDTTDAIEALNRNVELEKLKLQNQKATLDLDNLTKMDALMSDKEYGELMKRYFETDRETERQALLDAAEAFEENNKLILASNKENSKYLENLDKNIIKLTDNPAEAAQVDILDKLLQEIIAIRQSGYSINSTDYLSVRA